MRQSRQCGLYYYGARYYNPKLSIWYGVDPLAETMPGWSPYAYAFDNPINKTDYTGMCPDGDCPDEVALPDPTVMIAGGINIVRAPVSNLVGRGINLFRAEDNQINNRYEVGGDGSLILVTGVPRETAQEKLVNTFFDVATIGLAVAGGPEGVLMAEGGKSPPIKGFNDIKAKFYELVSGHTRHDFNKSISRNGGKGVKINSKLDAIRNPKRVTAQSGGRTRFTGKSATVVTNRDAKIITNFGKSRNSNVYNPQGRATGGGKAQRRTKKSTGTNYNPKMIR